MKRLWVQLALAFAFVSILSVVTVGLLTNRQTSASFRSFLAQEQIQESGLVDRLAEHYAARGSWDGVDQVFAAERAPGAGPGQGMGMGRGMMRGAPGIVLADTRGNVVYEATGNGAPALQAAEMRAAVPVVVQDTPVGYLTVRGGNSATLPPAARVYLDQVNRSLIQAGLIAGMLGAVLGLLIARGLAAPLGHLADAAQRIAQGDLAQRVPVAGAAEVTEAATSFNEMADSLQRSEELRRGMVADIAHELRTPLTVVQGNLRAILDDVYPLEKAEIATIYDETLMLRRLVEDLRDLASADAGQLRLNCQPVALPRLIEQVASLFSAPAQENEVTITHDCPDDLPPALADPERVGQVLRNLVANALRYTPAGGVITMTAHLLTGDQREARGDQTAQASSGKESWFIVTVEDTGSGIASEDLAHVFERFWRADRSRARGQGGSGLGLAIARQIVQAHGGQIGVTSHPGQGTRFWLTLPVALRQGDR
jgi:two-component system OmpR family sensor kinase/two-component system sensor histidine kinase BaeS